MKILLISPEDTKGSRWGGVSTYTTLMTDYLGRLGQDVYMLTPGDTNESLRQQSRTILRVRNFRERKKISVLKVMSRTLRVFFPQFEGRLHWAIDVLSFVNNNGPFDIIEAPEWGNSTLFVSLFSKQKTVVKLHRSLYCYKKDNDLPMSIDVWLVCVLEFLSIIFASAITSPTRYMLSYYRHLLAMRKIIRRKHIDVIPYGIEIETKRMRKPRHTERQRYILFVGRIEKAKGSYILIRAFKRVVKQFKNVRLLLIGEDTPIIVDQKPQSYKRYLRSYIHRNHLGKKIRIFDKKARRELKQYYSDSLFVVVPSVKNENLPFVVLEAMSHSKTVIASNTGGLPEIIQDRINGLLFRPNDSKDLAEKIMHVLRNDREKLTYEQQNANRIREFDIQRIALQTLSFYKEV